MPSADFLDHLFRALGHDGVKEAGASRETRVAKKGGGKGKNFIDLLWPERPVGKISLADLPQRAEALAFLLPKPRRPLLNNNRVEVTREAANELAKLFRSLVGACGFLHGRLYRSGDIPVATGTRLIVATGMSLLPCIAGGGA